MALKTWRGRTLALAGALLTARALVVALRLLDEPPSLQTSALLPLALLAQDAQVLLAFAGLDAAAGLLTRRRLPLQRAHTWTFGLLTAAAIAWTALNVPVARVLGTPLTEGMLGAVGGALGDSIRGYLTPSNLGAMAAVVVVAAALARLATRLTDRRAAAWALFPAALAALTALTALIGPSALHRVDTQGLHHNALYTLARGALRSPSTTATGDATDTLPALQPTRAAPAGPRLVDLPGAARHKHLIVVSLESTGARFIEAFGAERSVTPHLDRLLQRALLFERAYAVYPESIKGFYSWLCSLAPAPHTEAADYAHARLPRTCLGHALSTAGYATGLFHSGRFVYLGMQHVIDDQGFDEARDAGHIGGRFTSSFGTDDLSTARALLDFLDRQRAEAPDRPIAALYMPIAGHHPYRSPGRAPGPLPETSERDSYLNDLRAGDQALGELIAGVQARGLGDEVLWVVFGDHGEAFREHPGNVAHSLHIWEENVHVPLAFIPPGPRPPRRVATAASLLDVLPTTLDLLGLPIPPEAEGRSLLSPGPDTARFFTDYGPLKLGLRHGDWKLIWDVDPDRARLYDLATDPHERADLAAAHPDRVNAAREHLRAWQQRQRARVLGPPAQPPPSGPPERGATGPR